MKQIERAKTELDEILAKLKDIELNTLGEVLDEAQNRPPQGAADGSFEQRSWDTTRAAYNSLRDAIHRTQRAALIVEQRMAELRDA